MNLKSFNFNGHQYIILFKGKTPVGRIIINDYQNGEVELSILEVDEQFRGKGYSKLLLEEFIALYGNKFVSLIAFPYECTESSSLRFENQLNKLVRLYERFGFLKGNKTQEGGIEMVRLPN